jgi:hypothetical protein
MTKIIKISNKHEQEAQNTEKSLHEGKVREMVLSDLEHGQKPFSLRFGTVSAANNVMRYTLHGLLGIGAAGGIMIALAGHGNHWAVWAGAGLFGGIAGVILEAIKHKTQDELFYSVFYFKKIKAGLLLGALSTAALSTIAVLPAANLLPKATAPTIAAPESLQIDSTDFKAEMQRISKLEALQQGQTYKGKLTKPAQELLKELAEERQHIKANFARRTAIADSTNKAKLAEYETQVKANAMDAEQSGFWSMWISVALEVLLVTSAGWAKYYRFKCLVERPELIESQNEMDYEMDYALRNNALRNEKQQTENQQHLVLNKRNIGFEIPNKTPNETHSQTHQTHSQTHQTQDKKPKTQAECKHCGTHFTKKTTWQKYCSESCRIASFEQRTGRKVKKGG